MEVWNIRGRASDGNEEEEEEEERLFNKNTCMNSVMSGDSQKALCKPLAGSHPSLRKVN